MNRQDIELSCESPSCKGPPAPTDSHDDDKAGDHYAAIGSNRGVTETMTKTMAAVLAAIIELFLVLVPGRRKSAVRARLYARMKPILPVAVGEHSFQLVVPDRHSLYWVTHAPQAEADTNAWIASFSPEDVLFDVGANVGFYALLAARCGARRVYAFEPNPLTYAALVQNIFVNRLESVIVPLNLAVADNTGLITFGMSSLDVGTVGNEIGHGNYQLNLPAFSLDDFSRMPGVGGPSHLKIDVDGLEAAILRGADQLLGNPGLKSLLLEINDANQSESRWMLDYLAQHGLYEVPPPVAAKGLNKFFRRNAA